MVEAACVIKCLENIAPLSIAESWDNAGLQIGTLAQQCHRVGVCLDITEDVIDYAKQYKIDLIISHHPLFFKPIYQIDTQSTRGRWIKTLLSQGIAVYASHTNFDMAPEGLNMHLAQKIGLKECQVLEVKGHMPYYKVVVFVPSDHLDTVMEAVFMAGGGRQGDYDRTSFRTTGVGTFRPLSGSQPFIGETGSWQEVEEQRLEVLVSPRCLESVVQAVVDSHPYEEVAYDILTLPQQGPAYGLGSVGGLEKPLSIQQLMSRLCDSLGLSRIRLYGSETAMVKRVAVCGGSGGNLIEKAYNMKVDVLINGDVGYHQAQQALEMGLVVLDAGHGETEEIFVEIVRDYLQTSLDVSCNGVEVIALPVTPLASLYRPR